MIHKQSLKYNMKQIIINPDTSFFPIFQKVIKQSKYPNKEMTIKILDKERSLKVKKNIFNYYLFKFDWQDDNHDISGVDVYLKETKNE
jgi:hypothetical protein